MFVVIWFTKHNKAPVYHQWASNVLFVIEKPKLCYCSCQEAKIGVKIRNGSGLNILEKSISGRQNWHSKDKFENILI
jgi:hypothetical protein